MIPHSQSRQFHTVGPNSPIRIPETSVKAYESVLGGGSPETRAAGMMMRNTNRAGMNGSMSALEVRKGQQLMTSIKRHRDPMNATGIDDYVTASKIAFSNANRIPTVKIEDNKHLRYRPNANRFDKDEENLIQNYDNRGKLI